MFLGEFSTDYTGMLAWNGACQGKSKTCTRAEEFIFAPRTESRED